MNLRSDLERRVDVSDEDIGDIIETAQMLQREAEAQAQQLTVEELGAIAEDLDIDREYVEKAIELRNRDRLHAAAERRETGRRRRRAVWIVGACVSVLLVGVILVARSGADSLSLHHQKVEEARGRLDQVQERFALSAPHSMALVEGDSALIREAVARVQGAADTDARLAAANELNLTMADGLAALSTKDDPAASQVRLNLHYELAGFQNRIAVESKRLDLLESEYRRARGSVSARLAGLFGMGP